MRLLTVVLSASLLVAAQGPRYNDAGELLRPENYREWVWLTSGVGMTYGPAAAMSDAMQLFDNVFVDPEAWRSFRQSGRWPDKTQFVLEIRYSQSQGSINKGGHFQTDVAAVEMAVKDAGQWSYYNFPTHGGQSAATAKALPKNAACYTCHQTNGAVENTFTQFYPTALEIAQSKGTVRPSFQEWAPSPAKLYHTVDTQGWDKARSVLGQARTTEPGALILQENALNLVGYELMSTGRQALAAEVFRHVAAQYPKSANAADSLAEALERTGHKAEALEASRRALTLLSADNALPEARRTRLAKAIEERIARLSKP